MTKTWDRKDTERIKETKVEKERWKAGHRDRANHKWRQIGTKMKDTTST